MISIPPIPVVVGLVRRLDGQYFLCREVAGALGVSTATIRRLGVRDMLLAPTVTMFNGTRAVAAYDMATVERLSTHLRAHRSPAGRPRLWTDAERSARRAAYSALGRHRRQAAALRRAGDHQRADEEQQASAGLAAQLRVRHERRSGDLHRVP